MIRLRSSTDVPLPPGLLDQWKRCERRRSRPDQFHRGLIASAFGLSADDLFSPSRSDDREVGSDLVDMTDPSARLPRSTPDAIELLALLTDADSVSGASVHRLTWSDVTADTITHHLFGVTALERKVSGDGRAPATAAIIRATAAQLMALDFAYGGPHVRDMLLLYFRTQVVPALRSPSPRERQQVFGAAAEVAQLLGWSAYDAGLDGAAQRYFLYGLRLAGEAGDEMLCGRLLSNLSHQANYLGRRQDALHYSRAAQAAAHQRCTPTVMAMLLAMEARALAGSGEARACAQVLNRAEQVLGSNAAQADPDWIYYFSPAELAGEAAHCFRDLGLARRARLHAADAVPLDADTPGRTRAFIGMVDAAGALAAGDVDEAVALAARSIEGAEQVRSSRYDRYVEDFHAALARSDRRAARAGALLDSVRQFRPTLQLAGT